MLDVFAAEMQAAYRRARLGCHEHVDTRTKHGQLIIQRSSSFVMDKADSRGVSGSMLANALNRLRRASNWLLSVMIRLYRKFAASTDLVTRLSALPSEAGSLAAVVTARGRLTSRALLQIRNS